MEFTRQPIIETVITAKEGFKLVVRSSKGSGQEEYFVEAVEVVSFGNSCFYRSTEKPKAFLVPASDYEILEVREARMVLKNVGFDKTIKIGGGKEASIKLIKEPEKVFEPAEESQESSSQSKALDKKRDRRKSLRRRRGKDDVKEMDDTEKSAEDSKEYTEESASREEAKIELPEPKKMGKKGRQAAMEISGNLLKSLLPPPPNLIKETINKYRENELFKDAFFREESKETSLGDEESFLSEEEAPTVKNLPPLTQPEYGSFEISEEEEENIYLQRKKIHFSSDFEDPFEIFGETTFTEVVQEREESLVDFEPSKDWLPEKTEDEVKKLLKPEKENPET